MAQNDKPDAGKEAKGVAQDFLQTLGLVHLILGGLALYWVRLWYGPATATFFPLTGYDFVNVALLACGAAAIGMVISIVATICMGVVQYGIRKSDVLKYYTGLEGALQKYRQLLKPTEPPPQDNLNKIELAASHVIAADSKQRLVLEEIQTKALLSYSIALLAIPYTVYLYKNAPPLLWRAVAFCILAFSVLGCLLQLGYVQKLRFSLTVLFEGRSGIGSSQQPSAPGAQTER